MKHTLLYILIFALYSAGYSQGRTIEADLAPVSFADTIRLQLKNTHNTEAEEIGKAFQTAWGQLNQEQQNKIEKQTQLLRRKGYAIRPNQANYFGAIAAAINVEQIDPERFNEYLEVCGQVIESYENAAASSFFKHSKSFFEHHALHFEKTFRLYAQNDNYHFEFIAPEPAPSWDDPLPEEDPYADDTYDDTGYDDDTYSDTGYDDQPYEDGGYDDTYTDDTYADDPLPAFDDAMPSWLTPPPPPLVEGPVLTFDKVTLNLVTHADSVFIKNTKGVYSLKEQIFVGEEGTFDWSPAGLSPDSVYCDLTTYHFPVNSSTLTADLVKLHYKGKIADAIPGKFEFKPQPRRDSVPSTYPRFESYQNDIVIENIAGPNVEYVGGFSLTGNKISSKSVSGKPSKIDVFHEQSRKLTAYAPTFNFLDSAVVGQNAALHIYQGNDSITHSNVRIKYDYAKDEVMIQHEKGVMHYTPYASSFFGVYFSADVMKWRLAKDSMDVFTRGGRNTVPMIIESADFYNAEDFRLLQGHGFGFHPLTLTVSYCLKKRVREFYPGDLASFAKRDIGEIKAAMEFLSEKGLVIFDRETELVTVTAKAVEIYRSAKGESDYDNIKIHSVIDSLPNATISFPDGAMTVRGVEEFNVSDSLNVIIKPDTSTITILQNRDIKFDGMISAGNFEIRGKGFTFKYDSFFVELTQIDSINFFVNETNSKGQNIRRKVNNSMVGADSTAAAAGGLGNMDMSSGTLFISRSNNKSGKSKIPNYPRMDASTGGVIYFDRQEVLAGVYDRSMFFVVPPFKLDSLNDADPASINFEGTFVSSGMFPSFKEKLHTMPDKSLGFEHAIPQAGYQLYNGDGKMNGALSMNNRGLRGAGKIEYLAATVSSKDFLFYPDSVIAMGSRATIKKEQFGSVLFPQASLPDYEMKWYPKEDKMKLKNMRAPFNFYDSTAQLNGKITISKEGVKGEGKMDTRGTELLSKEISFTGNTFGARHAKFKVNSNDPRKPLMFGTDVRLKFNLEENYADISPEIEGEAAINFPYAQVKTSIPNARWDLTEQTIVMTKNPTTPLESSYFYSTREELDSLSFNADRAEYDMKTQELKVSGIPYIVVADAKITPENNEVLILENSKIGTLKNTTIVVDTLNGYHRLTEGVVDIVSRKEFTGYATYQYVNMLSDTFAIKMSDFHLEPIVETEASKRHRRGSAATMQTVATGAVAEEKQLVLGAGMFYKGDMVMYATKPALQLNGFVKLDIRNIDGYDAWIVYSQTGDETDVVIDFDNAVTEEGTGVDAGLHFSMEDNGLYITFLNDKKNPDDEDFFVPSGSLFFDPESNEYKIEDRQKSAGTKLSGKVFSYNDDSRRVRFEGPIGLFHGFKDFNITATALGSGNMQTDEIRMNSFLVMDSNIPSQAFETMARDLKEVIDNEGADDGLGDQTELLYKIADIVGEKVVKDFEERSLEGYVSLGSISTLAKPLVLANVNLKWSEEYKAFYSEGNIGVSNIYRNDINGGFEGFLEVKRGEDGGSVFNVFFKASPDSWYYFGFEGSRLLVQSSNESFNDIIGKKTNAAKAKIGEVAFVPGSDEETLAFINRFREQYYGIESPYSLAAQSRVQVEENAPIAPTEEKKLDDDGF